MLPYTPARTLKVLYECRCYSDKFRLQSRENAELSLCGGD